jgi:DNA-binding transcriptional LysR family regulator
LELEHIHEFCVLAEIGNFLEAADQLDIAQSTLSRHLRSLETELGTSLFIRTTRRVKINDCGKILLSHAKKLLEIEQNIRSELLDKRRSTKNLLSIGSIPVMNQYDITLMLACFQKANPLFIFEITESISVELKKKIRDGILDFAFVRERDETKHEFVSLPYLQDTIAAILPAKHPLAASKSIRLNQLRKENFLLLPKDTLVYKLCIQACSAAGFDPQIRYTSNRTASILELVAKGMGITLLNRRAAAPFISSDMVIVDVVPVMGTRINLIYLKNRVMTYACKTFLRYFKEQTKSSNTSLLPV